MRKNMVVILSFVLLIVLTASSGCVPLPTATQEAGSAVATPASEAEPALTPTSSATGASESNAGSPEPTATTAIGPTPEVGTAVPAGGNTSVVVGTPVPAGAGTATEAAPGQGRSVTLEDNGKTLTFQPGDRFLLNLGEGYNWEVSIADQNVVSRVIGVLTIRGSQGLFEAHQQGTTSLTASGDPVCRSQQPPCEMPSRLFEVQIVVNPPAS